MTELPTTAQQVEAERRRADRLANPDPDFADDERSGYVESLGAYTNRTRGNR